MLLFLFKKKWCTIVILKKTQNSKEELKMYTLFN